MPTSHDLTGLIKFIEREPWRECFDEVFHSHFGLVLEEGDIEFDDIPHIIGDTWTMILWGCAFEDFLTQTFEVEGGNIVDEYLKRRGWKEKPQVKAYMQALRHSVMSLYEVSQIVPGESFIARDLIRGGDPLTVSEKTATKTLKPWGRIAARIVPVMGKNVLAGGVLPFTPQASDALFDDLRQMFGKKSARKLPLIKDEELQSAASSFTLSWLLDMLGRAMQPPSMLNGDGDELMFHKVRFLFTPGVLQKDVAARVNSIPGMSQETAKFWNWLERKAKTRKPVGASYFDTIMDNGARVLGNIELKGKFLQLSTNSAKRAQDGTILIRQALGDLVRAPLSEICTVEQVLAKERSVRNKKAPAAEIPPEVAEQLVHQLLEQQYRETLDQPVGMLGNKTPRQAAKTAAGRQKIAEWLKYLENQSSHKTNPADPMATYSFEWMWRELGVLDLRQ